LLHGGEDSSIIILQYHLRAEASHGIISSSSGPFK
jgi:hypothetical protein